MKIHGHPQKTDYRADGSDWPITSSQGHWRPGSGLPQTLPALPVGLSAFDAQTAHTHLDVNVPIYGEITGPLTIEATIKLFHTAGYTGGIYSPLGQIRDIVYADTGTSTPPEMRGDPMGLKQWNVRFIFDPALKRMNVFPPVATVPPHGWFTFQVAIKVGYDNGDSNETTAIRSMYSMLDPTQPETPWTGTGPMQATACSPNTLRRPDLNALGNQMGEVFSQYSGLIPLAPIQEPWHTEGFFYAYAQLEGHPGFQFPDGTLAIRSDANFHAGIPGTDVVPSQHFQGNSQFLSTPVTFDPAVIGMGTHTMAAFWQEPDGQGNDATAVFVFPLTVGKAGPPPPQPTTVPAPDVVGLSRAAAAAKLQAVGLTLGMVMEASDPHVPAGDVISQLPAAGVPVVIGDGVMVTLSTGAVVIDPPPPPRDVWVVMKIPPVFMTLVRNGVPTDRFRICDPTEPMTDPAACPEIVTKP